ncbi:hypothetical protein TgHK011_010126 [Trichoderma gracile]|nr:hypothetical protein TgHK011_010126 [Trichoderma gracile]
MADVRALLRQQRAARRITHPHAAYSDTGKLLCTLCRDQIRAESHWDAHLAGDKHRKRLSAIAAPPPTDANGIDDYCETDEVNDQVQIEDLEDDVEEGRDQRADTPSSAHKRKLDHGAAASLDEHDTDKDADDEDEVRRKRSRHASPETGRRKPQGPSQGVQVQMPSRSTTPADSQHSGSSAARSTTKLATSLPSRQASNLATPASSSSMSIQQEAPSQPQPQRQPPQQPQPPAASTSQDQQQQQQINEDEWAAFEADIAAETAPYDADAVISRPAMTAEEAAAAKEAAAAEQEALENPESRKTKADADIEDEREEASRALEEEFEEMQELEARVQRLKEKREALMRRRGETVGQDQADGDDVAASLRATTAKPSSGARDEGNEKAITTSDMNGAEAENNDEDDEDDEEDEEDDWDGFRFRTGR